MESISKLHHRWIRARADWLAAIRDETSEGARQRHHAAMRRGRSVDRIATTVPGSHNDLALQLHVWWTEFGLHGAGDAKGDEHLEAGELFIAWP